MRRWTVTSRALVGSSAMSRRGRAARPMAMRARWRMPPENSCGYWRARRAASGSPASSSSRATCSSTPIFSEGDRSSPFSAAAIAARRSSATPARPLARRASLTWKPMDHTGLRLVMGSWGTRPMLLPRSSRYLLDEARVMSSPSKRIVPPVTWPVPGSRPMTAAARVDLPEPDSPTTATDWPG